MIESRESLLIPEVPDRQIFDRLRTSCKGDLCFSRNPTCQIELFCRGEKWEILARDQDGNPKTAGGDEFYIRYEEFVSRHSSADNQQTEKQLTCQAVALIYDRGDGYYNLDFVSTPLHQISPSDQDTFPVHQDADSRLLTIFFEYTNGIGKLAPPMKKDWNDGGYSHRCYELPLGSGYVGRPRVRKFCPPSPPLDLGSFDTVLAFGDSTMDQFVRQRPNKKGKYYFHPNIFVGEKLRQGLNSRTLEEVLNLLDQEFSELLKFEPEGCIGSICLILGSCLWDILDASDFTQGEYFEDHLQACIGLVTQVRLRYPGVTVAWKSPMAVHIHWVDLKRVIEHDEATATLFGRERIRYMSSSRSKFLYRKQKTAMLQIGVPFLDIYEASYLSADQLYPSDGRHYRPDLNRLMLSWFTPATENTENYYQNTKSNQG